MYVTGGMFCMNRTTSGPKSVLRLMLDKVILMCSDLRCPTPVSMFEIKVPNKSLSHELNSVLFSGGRGTTACAVVN